MKTSTWVLLALFLPAAVLLVVQYARTLRGRRLDNLIVSGDLERIRRELAIHPQLFKPRRGGSAGPLHIAAHRGQTAVVKLLAEHDVEVNARDIAGNTPLHLAADSDANEQIVTILLGHDADVNARNNQGQTPLAIAIARKARKTADLLIEAGGEK